MKPKKVLFLYLGTENLGIEALSSYLKMKGHETELLLDPAMFSGFVVYNNKLLSKVFDSGSEETFKRAIINSSPDLVAFSVFTGNYLWALKWAKVCKELFPKAPVVFGGAHPTSPPSDVVMQDVVDCVVVAVVEDAIEELLSGLNDGRLPSNVGNTLVKKDGQVVRNPVRPYIRNLDDYPFLDKELFYNKIPGLEECYLTMTSRGCPFRCTYCVNNIYNSLYEFEKGHVRRRSVDNVIEELKEVKRRGIAKKIFFGDDVFIFDKKWVAEFSEKYKKEIDLPFWCTAYPTVVDRDTIQLLKKAGCWLITMGVQSGSPRVRNKVFCRAETNETIVNASKIIKESGIVLGIDNIFGAPSETEDDLLASLELYAKIKPDRIHTFWLTYFPKTAILDKAFQEGLVTVDDIARIKEGHVGQFDFGGSINNGVKMYLKYEFIYHFLSLVRYNERIWRAVLKWKRFVPASVFVNKMLISFDSIKNRDSKFFYLIKTLFFKRNVP